VLGPVGFELHAKNEQKTAAAAAAGDGQKVGKFDLGALSAGLPWL
jgi:hypothetical protein